MIQIKEISVYIHGKLFSDSVFYNEKKNLEIVDDFPYLDIKRIEKIKAEDFPDRFCLHFQPKPKHNPIFDFVEVTHKGKKIIVDLFGNIELNEDKYDWLFWNPEKLLPEIYKLTKAKGYKIRRNSYDGSLELKIEFKTEGTLGAMLNTVMEQMNKVQLQAEKNLLKMAVKQIGK